MAKWKSEDVLNKWLGKSKEEQLALIQEMGDEIDTAFHKDIVTLLESRGVNTDSLSMNTVGILNALDGLINQDTAKSQWEALINRIIRFVAVGLQEKFPQINGAGFGLPLGMPNEEYRKISELPEDQQTEEIKELLGIRIMTETDLTEEQKQEVYKLIGEKFFSFHIVGKMIAY